MTTSSETTRPHMDNADDLVRAITDAYNDDDTDTVRRLITAHQTQMTAAALVLDVLDHLTHIDPTTDHHPNLRAILGSWR